MKIRPQVQPGGADPQAVMAELRSRAQALAALDCFGALPEQELLRLAELPLYRGYAAGSRIASEQELTTFVTVVERGSVRLTLVDRGGRDVLIGVLNRGDCFGEAALFGDLFRGMSATAETDCFLLYFPLAELRGQLAELPQLTATLRQIYRRRMVESTLGRVPVFSQLSPVRRAAIAARLQPAHVARGMAIIRQGEPGEALYLVVGGQVVVEQHSEIIATLREGDFFGEIALLTAQPHNATVRAVTPVDLLLLPATQLRALLNEQHELGDQLRAVVDQRRTNGQSIRSNREAAHRLTMAVQHGLRRGTHLLVRTPELCPPGCRLCEQACVARHHHQRLHLNGVQLGALDVLDACRQCRHGAECIEACPEDALEWNVRGALFVNQKCTGCGACVEACPYDAVDAVPLTPGEPSSPLWSLWRRLTRPSRPVIPLSSAGPTQRADKCDLCHGYDDLACLTVCPTGSLKLVPVEEIVPL